MTRPLLRSLSLRPACLPGLLLTLVLPLGTPAETATQAFQAGNLVYAEADYTAAVEAYTQAVRAGAVSPQLHYNLGTAHAQLGDWGRARYHLERARTLDPADPDIRYNLDAVRERLALPEADATGAWADWAHTLPTNTWAWLLGAGLWCALLLWAGQRWWGSGWWIRLPQLAGLLLATLAAVAISLTAGDFRRGIVLEPAPLRLAPLPQSTGEAELPAGTPVTIRRAQSGFLLVRSPEGAEGYLTPEEVGRLWPR